MTGGTNPKVRLVRCPKCRLVLQEVPDFPVYRCGGCDAILVAKTQKSIAKSTSVLQAADNLSIEGHHLQAADNLSIEGHHKKDRDTSRSSSSYSYSDCEKLDENGSNKGQLQLENLEYCNAEQQGVSSGTCFKSTELHDESVAEANDDTLRLEANNNPQATREINLTVSDNLLEQPQKTELVFDRLRSVDTFETSDFGSPSSGLSGPDGGMDDQKLHSLKNSYKAASYLVPEETHPRDKLSARGTMDGSSGMQDPARNLSSDLSNKKHFATQKYSRRHRDEPLEPGNWPRLDIDECPSHIPFSRKASLRKYEHAGPSRESQDEFPFDSTFYPHEKIECNEQENMKLLRMVRELQDQITKTCHLNGRSSTDASWRQNHFPKYCCQEPPEDENFYPRYHGRHGQKSSWSQQGGFACMPFSGGGIDTRYSIDNSCLYCHPQDWKLSSEQLHPPVFRHDRELCRAHLGHSCCNSSSSCSSTPLRYLESDFSNWTHVIKSDDQRYRDHELNRYLREKNHSVRRHLRPTAGGAPFVTCYFCFTTLQLPADFLLFKRKLHQLRCGACTKILKFSFVKGIHIVPYELVAAAPPPCEVSDRSEAINAAISTLASCSHGVLQADPMSNSDDCSHTFSKSCFTDGDPVSPGNTDTKTMFSSSYEHMEQRKDFVLKQSQNKHKTSTETFDSAEPSSTMSRSEEVSLEELPPTGGTSLHHLMGYSSPSQLIYGLVSSISGTSSVHSGETSD
ncbi:putative -like protein [Gossypium arboreum]|uniref:Putative-like protein n=2 Tax=Gossypium arboreum TaxID=29729 RepID=A0A0B0MEC7_GOSAR|nr:protein ENHANCED DISEASE RESISTANCE 4 [Gossypium arboreum]XP_017614451.1 protein ENHANCED DISEASE RESISTANCE 4 [Gossypium arboreum]KAK5834749.1 hypothetical protein PVK06_010425 [Gossypium arboreum]KHG00518.1 putative -like protein [Gossypium arboreum]